MDQSIIVSFKESHSIVVKLSMEASLEVVDFSIIIQWHAQGMNKATLLPKFWKADQLLGRDDT